MTRHGPTGGRPRSGGGGPARNTRARGDTRPRGFAALPEDGPAFVYGLHAVRAALLNPARRPRRLWTTRNAWARLDVPETDLTIAPEIVAPDAIARLLPDDAVHQGALLEADPLPVLAIEDLEGKSLVVVLDQVTDPQNVGAVLRSAAAFAADALVVTHRHSPRQSGALAKAASGAMEHVPVVAAGNLARALEALGEQGFRRIGLAGEAETSLEEALERQPAPERLALVLGAEGKGLRQRTRAICDDLARFALPGAVASLNVSNAAALALYAARRAEAAARARPAP